MIDLKTKISKLLDEIPYGYCFSDDKTFSIFKMDVIDEDDNVANTLAEMTETLNSIEYELSGYGIYVNNIEYVFKHKNLNEVDVFLEITVNNINGNN